MSTSLRFTWQLDGWLPASRIEKSSRFDGFCVSLIMNKTKLCCIFAVFLLLSGCEKEMQKDCPLLPFVNGYTSVENKYGVSLKIPGKVGVVYDQGCSEVRSVQLQYYWIDGRLVLNGAVKPAMAAGLQRVILRVDGFAPKGGYDEAAKNRIDLLQTSESMVHSKYPLELYKISGENKLRPEEMGWAMLWGVKNTRNPLTGHPFLTNCDISMSVPGQRDSMINGEFSSNGDSKCRGRVFSIKGNKVVSASIDVWSDSVLEIDKIYNAASSELTSYIQGK